MTDQREAILQGLEPLFEEARRDGKWFWCRYQDLWFSPDELADRHANGKFIWGAVNWVLRDPQEQVDEADRRAAAAQAEADRIRQRIAS